MKKMKEIKLCRRGGCCPTVEKIEEDTYLIKDDYDGEVKLKKENIDILYESLSEL